MKEIISNIDDLEELVEKIIKNSEELREANITIDQNMKVINIKISGSKYNQSLTPAIMRSILSIQSTLNSIYKCYSGSLSKKEKNGLEINVQVKEGSSDLYIKIAEQLDLIKESVQKMTGDQVFSLGITALITYGLVTLGKKAFDSFDKKVEREISSTKDAKNAELLKDVVRIMMLGRKKALRYLKDEQDISSISFNGIATTIPEIKERVKSSKEKEEKVLTTLKDDFRVMQLEVNYDKSFARMDIRSSDDTEYKCVILQPGTMSNEDYKLLKNAQNSKPITLQLILIKQGEKIIESRLDKIL
ncbi:hypothetical protein [Gracilinema caldarium]|uniref:hypothetical protein n=1 Tax=Gracilinema caldarium TaxID=215591 RepID=UPI0026F23A61|nr:hypothetical protein [Gracilinema caldarium]